MFRAIKPALVLFLTCLIITGMLALTYSATKDTIRMIDEKTQMEAREKVLEDADSFEEADASLYTPEDTVVSVFLGKDKDGSTISAVVTVEPKGYGGGIKISVGVESDGTIAAIVIIEHEETPGLGAKINEEPFLSQFDSIKTDGALVVVKMEKEKDNEIEAISGATISSKAVTDGVNTAKMIAMEIFSKAGVAD